MCGVSRSDLMLSGFLTFITLGSLAAVATACRGRGTRSPADGAQGVAQRRALAESWGKRGKASPEAFRALAQAIGDSDVQVRSHAIWSIGTLGGNRLVPELVVALGDPAWEVRHNASWALERIGAEEVVPALRGALADKDPWRRVLAGSTLAKIGECDGLCVDTLKGQLRSTDEHVRNFAALALANGGRSARGALTDLLAAAEDPSSTVRSSAVVAIAEIGAAPQSVVDGLVAATRDSDQQVRMNALAAMQRLRCSDKATVEAAAGALGDTKKRVAFAAMETLSAIGQPAHAAVVRAAGTGEGRAKLLALDLLGGFDTLPPGGLQTLVGALSDSDWQARMRGASGLGRHGHGAGAKVIKPLRAALKDEHAAVRLHAQDALAVIERSRSEAAGTKTARADTARVLRRTAP